MDSKSFAAGRVTAVRARSFSGYVPLTTGLLTTVSIAGLMAPVTFAKTGGNANLTMASNGQISATAALTAGATQSITGTATGADGVVLPFTASLTGQPTLGALALSSTAANTATSTTINIIGSVLGSTISGNVPPGMTLSSVNRTISGTPTTPGTYEFDLIETLAGALGSPKTTRVSLTVTQTPVMQLGIGLTGITTYGGYYPFANVMWSADDWRRTSGTGAYSQDFGLLNAAVQTDTFRCYISDAGFNLPLGTYTVLNPDGLKIGLGRFSDQSLSGGWTTATQFTFNYTPGNGLYVHVTGSVTANNGPLRIIMPGHLTSWQAGNYWNSEFLAFQTLAKPKLFRFMDWFRTNGSMIVNAADIATPNSITFSSRAAYANQSVPHLVCIDLCNRLGADMWINVPVRANDALVDSIAASVRDFLNPSLSAYIEYGNETWNNLSVFNDSLKWVQYLNNTAIEAVPNGAGGWTCTNHGLTNGEKIVAFNHKGNYGYGWKTQGSVGETWRNMNGTESYVKVLNTNEFEIYQNSALTTIVPIDPLQRFITLKKVVEAGKTTDLHVNHSNRSMQIWSRFDTIVGRGRVKHVLATQVAYTTVTTSRMAVSGMTDATDMVAVAPYYAGEWWQGTIAVASDQFTPSFWASASNRTVRVSLYAAGSTPALADVIAGSGAGFIATQTITRTDTGTVPAYATGSAFTGLTNGTSYAVFFVYTDGEGAQWMASSTITASATASTAVINDSNANMGARTRRNIQLMMGQIQSTAAVAGGKPLVAYECGSDYFGPGYSGSTPESLKDWRASYTQSVEEGAAFGLYYRSMAAAGIKVACQFNDVRADPGTFNMAESLTDTTDLRFQYFSSQNGAVPVSTQIAISDILAPNVATEPTYPYTICTLGDAGNTYSIYSGDTRGNFAVVGNQLRIINGAGINWAAPTSQDLRIEASNGATACLFKVSFATGDAWYEVDALFAFNSIADTTNSGMSAQLGADLSLTNGPGATIAGGMWSTASASTYSASSALSKAIDGGKPFLIASVQNRNNQTANYVDTFKVGNGATFLSYYGNGNFNNGYGLRVVRGALGESYVRFSTGITPTGNQVYWAFFDGTTIRAGINQVENTAAALPMAGSTLNISRDVFIGGPSANISNSNMQYGSVEIINRAGMTLADAKAMVAKMQALHGIT